tara:strand:+ start:9500 stop:10636 length:1137 start_codon:yes stop_codon:yes gene_type:complete
VRIPKRIDSKKFDVLIVDDEGSSIIKHCVPSSMSVTVLPIRSVLPWIMSFKFLFRIVARLLQNKKIGKSILYAIVDTVNPSVLITYNDNGISMGKWEQEFPSKLLIAVQNGVRYEGDHWWKAGHSLPVLYGFGDCERDAIQDKGLSCNEYNAVGSFKYGVYRATCVEEKRKYDFCFISQFSSFPESYKWLALLIEAERECFSKLVSFCQENRYSLGIALRHMAKPSYFEEEVENFKSLDKYNLVDFNLDYHREWSSYEQASSAEVVVAGTSTLAYEMFGAGKKTLFYGVSKKTIVEAGGSSKRNFEKLPDCVLADSLAHKPLYDKLDTLLKMDQNEYLFTSENARKYYMKYQKLYPHEIVKKRINDFVEKTGLANEST